MLYLFCWIFCIHLCFVFYTRFILPYCYFDFNFKKREFHYIKLWSRASLKHYFQIFHLTLCVKIKKLITKTYEY